jgi:hypothetical protein
MITCGICGTTFNEKDNDEVEQHRFYHINKFNKESRTSLLLPNKIRDMVRFWADERLKSININVETAKEQEEVDIARWTLYHMWFQDDFDKDISIDTLFEQYESEIKKRYPNTRLIPSRYERINIS